MTQTKSGNGGYQPIIRVRGLRTKLSGIVIHENLDLEVYQGEIIAIVGGSGTGKSVLLRTLLGLIRQRQGTIEIFGEDTGRLTDEGRHGLERRWGVLFQDGALFSSLSVAQNVQVPMREHLKLPQALMDEIARLKIAMVGLEADAAAKLPAELSGGMRKRAALARALALDPELLFLDEPTAGLDPIGASAFDELLLGLKRTLGLTVFMVTHDLDTIHSVADRVAVLADKRVLVAGTIADMLTHPHPWIHDYFHGPRARAAFAAESRAG
ncbi:MAG: ATP-binding cassette domain-containing protein [Proteobacteria bacterium]|nr:ATP-binding cassette domain-containing protein [Pseudomonadota bacterium]